MEFVRPIHHLKIVKIHFSAQILDIFPIQKTVHDITFVVQRMQSARLLLHMNVLQDFPTIQRLLCVGYHQRPRIVPLLIARSIHTVMFLILGITHYSHLAHPMPSR